MGKTTTANMANPVLVLTGPTGVGKTSIIERLAKESPVEVINCDSRQVYRQMKIGTDLPDSSILNRFPHHLYAIIDPSEQFSAGMFLTVVKELIPEIHARGRIPLICGGTFFYVRTLWDGMIEEPAISPDVAARVEPLSAASARQELEKADPRAAERIEANDVYRNKRALMVYLASGRSITAYPRLGGVYDKYDFHSFYLDNDREKIYEKINKRVELMFQNGLLNEIEALQKKGYDSSSPGLRTIGYREILEMETEQGPSRAWSPETLRKAAEGIAQSSRRYAKRQLTWFRHEKRLKRIDHRLGLSQISELINTLKNR